MTVKKTKRFDVEKVTDPVLFQVGDDEFEAIPANSLPAGFLANYFEKVNDSRIFDAHEEFFEAVLTEESYKLFKERLYSVKNPITVTVMGNIAAWLLGEVYMQGEATEESKQS